MMAQVTNLNCVKFGTETKVGQVRECKLVVLLFTFSTFGLCKVVFTVPRKSEFSQCNAVWCDDGNVRACRG